HPLYMGGYLYPMRFPKAIDCFVNLGAHMPDPRGGPPLVPRAAKIIHARIDSRYVGLNYPVDLAIVADVRETARALVDAVKARLTLPRRASIRLARWAETYAASHGLRDAYRVAAREGWDASPLTWPRLLLTVNEALDDDAIIVEELGTEDW